MYDFETVVDRNKQGSLKWEILSEEEVKRGVIPYSVADMEFKTAPEIVEGLKQHLDTDILGYTGPTEEYYRAVRTFMESHHGITFEAEEIVTTPGVVVALYYAVEAFSNVEDEVLILTPVYYPFSMVIQQQKRTLVTSELTYEDGKYEIDFEDLEKKLSSDKAKLMIFCSPHNPVGRVWRKDEVEKVIQLCHKHHVFLISDEIHMDLVMPGHKHYSAALWEEYKNNLMLCTSCSKTFNLAGLQVSNIIVYDENKRQRLNEVLELHHIRSLNNIAYRACILAYTQGEKWLEALLEKLNENRVLVKNFIEERLPMVKLVELEGTYLQWLDLTSLHLTKEELEKKMTTHSLYLDEGYVFGEGGIGFERVNLACPTSKVQEFLERLEEAIKE